MSIYFVSSGDAGEGLIKIGYAQDVASRFSTLQVGSAQPLQLLGFLSGEREDEEYLHKRFGHLRVRGEWFRPARELVEFIINALRVEANADISEADALEAWWASRDQDTAA